MALVRDGTCWKYYCLPNMSDPKTRVVYRLRCKSNGQYLGVSVTANPSTADFCGDTTVTLVDYGKHYVPWEMESAEQAEYVRQFSTPWYNSSMDTPKHHYTADELEVVRVEMAITECPVTITVPTPREFIERKMALYPKDRAFFERLLTDPDRMGRYSWWELLELQRKERTT